MIGWSIVFAVLNGVIAILLVALYHDLKALHARWTEREHLQDRRDPFASGFLGFVLSNANDDARPSAAM